MSLCSNQTHGKVRVANVRDSAVSRALDAPKRCQNEGSIDRMEKYSRCSNEAK
jgi:hypothetical protein